MTAEPAVTSPAADTHRRVLLIEDDADIAEAIGYQLEKAGLSVRVARTGEEGLEAARRAWTWSCSISTCPAWTGSRCAG